MGGKKQVDQRPYACNVKGSGSAVGNVKLVGTGCRIIQRIRVKRVLLSFSTKDTIKKINSIKVYTFAHLE